MLALRQDHFRLVPELQVTTQHRYAAGGRLRALPPELYEGFHMSYPKELYRPDGSYRICWGPEEHAKLIAEGWSNERLCFSLYFPGDALPPPPPDSGLIPPEVAIAPDETPEESTDLPVKRGPGRPRKIQE